MILANYKKNSREPRPFGKSIGKKENFIWKYERNELQKSLAIKKEKTL